MAINQKKRQKQLAKKNLKRKKTLSVVKKDIERRNFLFSEEGQLKRALKSPIHEALFSHAIAESGMGTAVLSRKLPNNDIAASLFLVDSYCLGVKSARFSVFAPQEYNRMLADIKENEELESVSPSCIRKLVESAIEYAKNLGFKPDADYALAGQFWGEVNSTDCEQTFTFGKDGKPFYVAGPYDTPLKVQTTLKTLRDKCGEEGFDYLLLVSPDDEFYDDEDEFYEDEFYEDEDEFYEDEEDSERKA